MNASTTTCQILIVGGGAAGIATAASLLARDATLQITTVDPADTHYYQPGWTMVGAGIFTPQSTARSMASLIPEGVQWIKAAVSTFEPQHNTLTLADGRVLGYQQLVVCPGLKLDWSAIDGLVDTLGANGVTSNYRYDWRPTHGSWCRTCNRGARCLPSRPCRSSAPVRHRRPCTCPAITG